MTLTSLSAEVCQQQLLAAYHEHAERIESWIGFLMTRAKELLSPNETIVEISGLSSPQRKVSGLQIGATRLVATAMRLSKERLQAALLLARHQAQLQKMATPTAASPCARQPANQPITSEKPVTATAATSSEQARYEEPLKGQASAYRHEFNPVRATDVGSTESLTEALARKSAQALASLSPGELNAGVRRERRQRAKELRRARQ